MCSVINVFVDPVLFLSLNQIPVPVHWVDNATFLPPPRLPVDSSRSLLANNATTPLDSGGDYATSPANITWREDWDLQL